MFEKNLMMCVFLPITIKNIYYIIICIFYVPEV